MNKIGIDAISYYVPSLYLSMENGEQKKLPLEKRNYVRIIKSWNIYLQSELNTKSIDFNCKEKINSENFMTFMECDYNPDSDILNNSLIHTQQQSSNRINHSNSKDYKVSGFRKGIKRDKEHYDNLTNEDDWD